MTERPYTFSAGCYYAVREDFNCQRNPNHMDKGMDHLIVAAIRHFETTPEKDLPEMAQIEVLALSNAADRRKLKGTFKGSATVPVAVSGVPPETSHVKKSSSVAGLVGKPKSIWDDL